MESAVGQASPPAPRQRAESRPQRTVTINEAYARMLSEVSRDLGLAVPDLAPGASTAQRRVLPSRDELIDAIQLVPDAKIDPGDESVCKSRRMPSLQQIAWVTAHFRLLHTLQTGVLVGYGDFSVWAANDAGPRVNAPIPREFWTCDWGWSDGPPDLTAAIVPDYAGVGLIPVMDMATGISIDSPAVAIGLDNLNKFIALMHDGALSGGTACPQQGVFKPHGEGWLIGIGEVAEEFPPLAGFAAISTLLHVPGHDVGWDRLQIVAGMVATHSVNPSSALRRAADIDLSAGGAIKAATVPQQRRHQTGTPRGSGSAAQGGRCATSASETGGCLG